MFRHQKKAKIMMQMYLIYLSKVKQNSYILNESNNQTCIQKSIRAG
jgi:hypothetical protein